MVFRKHIISNEESLKTALIRLDELAYDAILFTVNEKGNLVGSVTDGDIRRGLVKGITIDQPVSMVCFPNPRTMYVDNIDIKRLVKLRKSKIGILPIIDKNNKIVDIINFRLRKSLLPLDVVIMAGGKGMRLRPLTEKTPKPLLKIGDVPILEHNLRRYEQYGVNSIHITTNYLAEKIDKFVHSISHDFNTKIKTLKEPQFLGTIGSLRLVEEINQDYVMISNSDLLTNLDYEAFFIDFIEHEADISVVSIPYRIKIPYAIMDIKKNYIQSFQEKPNYTYFSNGGIYLIKKELIHKIPENKPFSATDLMQLMLSENRKIRTFAHKGYWIDIGQHEDYLKAQEDFKRNQF
tara:strand:- start:3888 stop:4934 length:1047 start_codon:yes stop_codon:yes gene_type:complete